MFAQGKVTKYIFLKVEKSKLHAVLHYAMKIVRGLRNI